MADTKNVNTTADESQQSPSNYHAATDNHDDTIAHSKENMHTKEFSDDTIYENMIFPS